MSFINFLKIPSVQAVDVFLYSDGAGQSVSISGSYSIIPYAYDELNYASGQRFYVSGSGFWAGSGITYSIPIYLAEPFSSYPSGSGYFGQVLSGQLFFSGNAPSSPFSGHFTGIVGDPTTYLYDNILAYQTGTNFFGPALTGNLFHITGHNYPLITTGILSAFIYTISDNISSYSVNQIIGQLTGMQYLHNATIESWTGQISQNNIYQSFSSTTGFIFYSPEVNGLTITGGSYEFWFKADSLSNEPVIFACGPQIGGSHNLLRARNISGGYQMYTITDNIETYTATGFIDTGKWYQIAWTIGQERIHVNPIYAAYSGHKSSMFYVNGQIAGVQNYFFYTGYSSGTDDGMGGIILFEPSFTGYFDIGGIPIGIAAASGASPLQSTSFTGETGVNFGTGLWQRYGNNTGTLPITYGGIFPNISVNQRLTGLYSIIRYSPATNLGINTLGDFSYNANTANGQVYYPFFDLVQTATQTSAIYNYKYLADVFISGVDVPSPTFSIINSIYSGFFYNTVYSQVSSTSGDYSLSVASGITGSPLPLQ